MSDNSPKTPQGGDLRSRIVVVILVVSALTISGFSIWGSLSTWSERDAKAAQNLVAPVPAP